MSLTIDQPVTSHYNTCGVSIPCGSMQCWDSKTTNGHPWFRLLRVDYTNTASCNQGTCRSRLNNINLILYCRLRELKTYQALPGKIVTSGVTRTWYTCTGVDLSMLSDPYTCHEFACIYRILYVWCIVYLHEIGNNVEDMFIIFFDNIWWSHNKNVE